MEERLFQAGLGRHKGYQPCQVKVLCFLGCSLTWATEREDIRHEVSNIEVKTQFFFLLLTGLLGQCKLAGYISVWDSRMVAASSWRRAESPFGRVLVSSDPVQQGGCGTQL